METTTPLEDRRRRARKSLESVHRTKAKAKAAVTPAFLSFAEHCARCCFSEGFAYKLERKGLGPAWVRYGRKKLIAPADSAAWLAAFVAKQRDAGAEAPK